MLSSAQHVDQRNAGFFSASNRRARKSIYCRTTGQLLVRHCPTDQVCKSVGHMVAPATVPRVAKGETYK